MKITCKKRRAAARTTGTRSRGPTNPTAAAQPPASIPTMRHPPQTRAVGFVSSFFTSRLRCAAAANDSSTSRAAYKISKMRHPRKRGPLALFRHFLHASAPSRQAHPARTQAPAILETARLLMTKPTERQQALTDILEQRVLVLDGAMGTMLHAPLCPSRPISAAARTAPRSSTSRAPTSSWTFIAHTWRPAPTSSRPTPSAAPASRWPTYGLDDRRLRAELRRRQAGAPGGRRVLHRRQAALRRRLHGSHHQGHHRHWRRHFPELRDGYYEQAKGLRRRRRGHPAGRDLQRYAQPQGRAGRHRAAARASSAATSPSMVSGTIEATGTMLAGQTADAFYASVANRRPALRRPQLRHRSGVHDRPPAHHQRDVAARASPAIPTPACRTRKASICETPDIAGRATGELRRPRLAQHRGRLLRHHRRAHPRHRADGRRQAAARASRRRRTAPTIPASNWWKPKTATAR